MNKTNILTVNSSSRYQGSITRQLAELVTKQIAAQEAVTLVERDLANGLPFIDENWVGANFTAPEDRSAEQLDVLSFSDYLVSELQQAEHIVIAAPVYNFNIPAVLKAWIDLIARARLTFQYGANGTEGLLTNKKAYIVMASGGVPIGSEMEFASHYLKHILAFVGITEVVIIDASKVNLTAGSAEIEEKITQLINA